MLADMTKETKGNQPAEDPKERYGRQWAETDKQKREDRRKQRQGPDYGGDFGL
ncbi:MAG TPA: hypothetical protein VIA06_11385 [Candidatus Dormibacteraeota bacterium]|jgi:hypothetical protein|nr:hypothetical protein [Candidatus Dormibacteraeota bacterium]